MTAEELKWFSAAVQERFLRYARVETTSDPAASSRPTTPGQLKLARMLEAELHNLGVEDLELVDNCYLLARIPGRGAPELPVVCFMAHLDTSFDVPGKGVKPILHEDYQGTPLVLPGGIVLDPAEYPELSHYHGDTIITASGDTLLGADDKAGVAEIMTALEYLLTTPGAPFPGLEILFTTDEETGRGMENFPLQKLKAQFCYTLDGGEEGLIEVETFEAYKVEVEFCGKSIHLGKAYKKMINAVELMQHFLGMLPGTEKPQTTFNREGYYCPLEVKGNMDSCRLLLLIRDFDPGECHRRLAVLRNLAGAVEAIYPGSQVKLEERFQYANMKKYIPRDGAGLKYLEEAIRMTGLRPRYTHVRGGTDGAWMSAQGIPTPNVFTGGFNFHSRYEWIPLSAMSRAAMTVVNVAKLWCGGEES